MVSQPNSLNAEINNEVLPISEKALLLGSSSGFARLSF
jgi:hypothetical protein